MFRSAVLLVVFVAGCHCFEMQFSDCGSRGATIQAVVADHCQQEPCTVHRGSQYTGHVNFTATKDYSHVHAYLHGGLGPLSLPWPVTHSNVCHGGLNCPLRAGQTYIYKLDMHCPAIAPHARIVAKWELKDEHHHDILCFEIPLLIN